MALAVNRTGTIFKKCDLSNHKPENNKNCAAGTCQRTCDKPDKCPHAWTLRSDEGKALIEAGALFRVMMESRVLGGRTSRRPTRPVPLQY
jgi:hypothetical protein